MKLSVIICTHNPRPQYLSRALEALRSQTVPLAYWELLLIDNGSGEPLASGIDLSWHPGGGIFARRNLVLPPPDYAESPRRKGDLLIFVDDDNVLQVIIWNSPSRIQ